MLRTWTAPRWLGRYVLTVAASLVLWRIGLWQWHKAHLHGSWVNYGYAIQWWLFAGFAVVLLVKVMLDEADPQRAVDRQPPPLPVDRRPVAPPPAPEDDDDLAAYNRHLAWLHANAGR